MANVTLASNSGGRAKIWKPYSHKHLFLGNTGTAAPDGTTYVTQTTGTSGENIHALCTDEYNCDFYYEVIFSTSGIYRLVYFKKYSLDGTLVDTIYASDTSGNARYTAIANFGDDNIMTIDIGVVLKFGDTSAFDSGDVFRINLPSKSTMRARRLYHGGYTTYIRIPETEGKAYRSDIIPANLLHRNITCLSGMISPFLNDASLDKPLTVHSSFEDASGNSALTVGLEWNINPQGADSTTASATDYTQNWSGGETWQMGTHFAYDIDPVASTDPPVFSSAASSDSTHAQTVTNRNATTVSGRAGHARIKYEFMSGTGTSKIHTFNQWFPTTLILG